ncbi:prolipoprotein diacylglyceryl transferase [Caulobacter sp. UC70_42]|uniref:prolipoprotein diacylglyceryl transferase n=1 Tax=Caulobacter sp. UC70_42 TaxID=3374551 RepID=UPI00375730F8
MPFPDFDPVALHLGPISIHWYALAYIGGILLGWRYVLALRNDTRLWGEVPAPLTSAQVDDLALWMTAGVILGGRLGYVLFYEPRVIWTEPLEILRVWRGGMSFHGGLIGVSVALGIFARRQGVNLLHLGDLVAPAVPIGLLLGRLANFINGELWGRTTSVPWGVVFCNRRLMAAGGGACAAGWSPRHPSQIYEALLEGVILFLILRVATHRGRALERRGLVSGLFLVGYGAFRIVLETVRNPDLGMPSFPWGLTMGMMLSAPLILAGLVLIVRDRAN